MHPRLARAARRRDRAGSSRPPRAGSRSRAAGSWHQPPRLHHQIDDRVDAAQREPAGAVAVELDAEIHLEPDHDLDRVERIEPEPGAEQRGVRIDLIGLAAQVDAGDQEPAHLLEHLLAACNVGDDLGIDLQAHATSRRRSKTAMLADRLLAAVTSSDRAAPRRNRLSATTKASAERDASAKPHSAETSTKPNGSAPASGTAGARQVRPAAVSLTTPSTSGQPASAWAA